MTATATLHPAPIPADRDELAAVIETQHERMLRLARRMVRCTEAAADVVQDATVAALEAWPRFHHRAAPATWLHRIVVNLALMYLRRNRFRREVAIGRLSEAASRKEDDPAIRAERADERDRLLSCLDELSADQRNVVELRDIQGLDTAGTALALGLSPNAVKIRLHRARRSLRARFENRSVRPAAFHHLAHAESCEIIAMPRAARAAS